MTPEFIYTAVVTWPDGDQLPVEARLDRDCAFDAATDHLEKNGGQARVYCIEHDRHGLPVNVSDVTADLYRERDIETPEQMDQAEEETRDWDRHIAAERADYRRVPV